MRKNDIFDFAPEDNDNNWLGIAANLLNDVPQVKNFYTDCVYSDELTPKEEAEISSYREFPLKDDVFYRLLARQEVLAGYSMAPKLMRGEVALLHSKREFPNAPYFRMLARQEILSQFGMARELCSEEQYHLSFARRSIACAVNVRPNQNDKAPVFPGRLTINSENKLGRTLVLY